jgi:hypothetical protein
MRPGERPGRPGISFDLDNYFPTDRDKIAMTIDIDLPPGCFDVEAGRAGTRGNEVLVRIDAAEQLGLCAAVVGGFTYTVVAARLRAATTSELRLTLSICCWPFARRGLGVTTSGRRQRELRLANRSSDGRASAVAV